MRDAYDTGRRVLEALERGREIARREAQERATDFRAAVERLAAEDALRFGARGRAGRIARRLHGIRSERHVKRILDALSGMSD